MLQDPNVLRRRSGCQLRDQDQGKEPERHRRVHGQLPGNRQRTDGQQWISEEGRLVRLPDQANQRFRLEHRPYQGCQRVRR